MAEFSPLRMQLRRKGSRRAIYSSEDEDRAVAQPLEVQDTHCDCSPQGYATGGLFPEVEEDETIIKFVYQDEGVWEMESDTSTPGYKRGRHSQEPQQSSTSSRGAEFIIKCLRRETLSPKDKLARQAVQELQEEGSQFSLPSHRCQLRTPSILILADKQLHHWPNQDSICTVEMRDWPIKRWSQAIHLGHIRILSHTVVLYLEGTRKWSDVPPIKNALKGLCKVIHSHGNEPRIFIANHLPRASGSPVQPAIGHTNFTLQQATQSICRSMGKVFELSIHEHFTSKKGKIIRPTHKYFGDGLTRLGVPSVPRMCYVRSRNQRLLVLGLIIMRGLEDHHKFTLSTEFIIVLGQTSRNAVRHCKFQ